ncbi:MAG: tetratricopeptide repeat protein [Chloroflexota bacterium]|nr:tetratricopeptide repeat protein [Chloroflexota bacterium]
MKRNTIIAILAGLLLVAGLVTATSAMSPAVEIDERMVAAANQLYRSGHHSESAQLYEQLVEQGARDSGLFYNLGNAYFQQGDRERAILNYERALQLAPRDADIRHNLDLARAEAGSLPWQEAEGPLDTLAEVSRRWLTVDELAMIALSAWFFLGFLIFLRRQKRSGDMPALLRYGTLVVLVLLLVSALSLGSRLVSGQIQPGGVIVASQVALSDSPGRRPVVVGERWSSGGGPLSVVGGLSSAGGSPQL